MSAVCAAADSSDSK